VDSSGQTDSQAEEMQSVNPELFSVPISSPSPISNFAGGDSAMSVARPSPVSDGGSGESVPANDCPIYLFQYEDEEFNLPIPASWTVFETKEKVAARYQTITYCVSLIFCARNLKDETLLIRHRIGNRKIIVYIRPFDRSLLESIGYGSQRSAEKPSDFIERVKRLEAETGQDRRTCSRCLIFYDYDIDRARDALYD
jgi:hypothetical protein